MKKLALPYLLVLSSLLIFQNCKKESTATIDVALETPTENQSFSGGQILAIKGTASDGDGLHTLVIEVTDDKTGALLFEKKPAVLNLKSYNFDEKWTIKVNDWTDATVKVTAKNHSDVGMIKTLKIKLWL